MEADIDKGKLLYKIIDAISSLGFEEMLVKIDQIICKITSADSTGIYTWDDKTQSVLLRASKLHFDIIGKLKMKLGEGVTGWVAKFGKVVVIEKNAESDPRFKRVFDLPDDLYESFLSVPIKSGNIIVGVINIKHKKPHKYTKDQIKLLEMIGKLVGKAVENADFLEKTKDLKDAVETQKSVTRAKGILMLKMKMDENKAFQLIRKKSMNERKTMREIADTIINAKDLIG